MPDGESIDTLAPWTIKLVSNRVRSGIVAAAQRENVTVGQWLERRYEAWVADGSPVVAQPSASAADITDLIRAVAEAARTPELPRGVKRQANALLTEALREARGLTRRPVQGALVLAPPQPSLQDDRPSGDSAGG